MKKITLKAEGGSWVATWHGDEVDEIRRLFGTTRLPTAYTASADPERVRSAVAALNPGYAVETE